MYELGKIELCAMELFGERAVDLAAVQAWAGSSEEPDTNVFVAFGGKDKSYRTTRFGEVASYSGKVAVKNRAGWWLMSGNGSRGTAESVHEHGCIESVLVPEGTYWYGTNKTGSGLWVGTPGMNRAKIRDCEDGSIRLVAGKMYEAAHGPH